MVKLFGPLTISYFMTGLLAGLLLFVIGGIGYFVSQNVLKIPRPSEIQLYKKKGWARFGLSLVITLGPVLEEYVFRGVLLRHSGSIWMLVLLSTVIFSLYHLSLFQLTPTFLLGLGLAGITLVTRDLWTATIAHITFNLIGLILLSLDKLPQQSKD